MRDWILIFSGDDQGRGVGAARIPVSEKEKRRIRLWNFIFFAQCWRCRIIDLWLLFGKMKMFTVLRFRILNVTKFLMNGFQTNHTTKNTHALEINHKFQIWNLEISKIAHWMRCPMRDKTRHSMEHAIHIIWRKNIIGGKLWIWIGETKLNSGFGFELGKFQLWI